mmetsp:Transcript_36323/g.102340  ORF Transcript_36323/g.102340 Transcript_36323/m.102340 type:complete len:204 (-) Transcript_36323:87-698(-)
MPGSTTANLRNVSMRRYEMRDLTPSPRPVERYVVCVVRALLLAPVVPPPADTPHLDSRVASSKRALAWLTCRIRICSASTRFLCMVRVVGEGFFSFSCQIAKKALRTWQKIPTNTKVHTTTVFSTASATPTPKLLAHLISVLLIHSYTPYSIHTWPTQTTDRVRLAPAWPQPYKSVIAPTGVLRPLLTAQPIQQTTEGSHDND